MRWLVEKSPGDEACSQYADWIRQTHSEIKRYGKANIPCGGLQSNKTLKNVSRDKRPEKSKQPRQAQHCEPHYEAGKKRCDSLLIYFMLERSIQSESNASEGQDSDKSDDQSVHVRPHLN